MENSFIQYLHDKLPKIIYKMEKYNILILRPWVFFHYALKTARFQNSKEDRFFSNKSKFAIQLREN